MQPKLENELKEIFPNLKYEISNDGIAVIDGMFSEKLCDGLIKYFDDVSALGKSYDRMQAFSRPAHSVADNAVDFVDHKFFLLDELRLESSEFLATFWNYAYKLYTTKFSVISQFDKHSIFTVKIQKTKPGEGYHDWHTERTARKFENRLMVFILYLNDIDEGGETEFLYLSRRVSPKKGRLLLWPSDYPHTHRGNPPINQTKYILTGWVEF